MKIYDLCIGVVSILCSSTVTFSKDDKYSIIFSAHSRGSFLMEYVFPCAELEYLHCSSNKAFITDDISVFLPVGVTVVVPSLLKNKYFQLP